MTVISPSSSSSTSQRDGDEPVSGRLGDRARRARTDQLWVELSDTTDELARKRIRDEIVRTNLDLTEAIVRRYRNRGIPQDDLVQAACVGLVKAVRGFDPATGNAFLAYAVPTIRGEVLRYFRDSGWAVRPPRPIQELQPRISAAGEQLGQQLGRPPRPSEIAEHLGVEVEDVIEALSADGCFTPSSLDAPVDESGQVSLGDLLVSDDDSERSAVEARIMLASAMSDLTERERRIVHLRFYEGLAQREIGEQIGVTQMQVSRLLTKILAKLRDRIAAPDADDAREGALAS